jgi:threonine/homoserine/homoserine lactone efflux protein
MEYAESLWLFALLLVGIIIVPGMDMLFVLANSLTGGRPAGLSATAGIVAGGVGHTLMGAVGVGVILRFAPQAFTVLVLAGAAYMAWIGVTLLRSSIVVGGVGAARLRSPAVAFRQGAITCLLNPKAYMFIAAVYPQFLKPEYGPIWSQALVLGVMTAAVQAAVYGAVALAAARSRDLLTSRPRATIGGGRVAGAIFVVVAALTAWQGATAI